MSAKEKLDQAVTQFRESFKQIKEVYKNNFGEVCKEIFEKHPFVEQFNFKQYANYFCDGDPCEFFIDTYHFYVNERSCYEDSVDDVDDLDEADVEKLEAAAKDICSFLNSLEQEPMKMAFGPDQTITVYRDGRVENNHFGDHD